MKALSLVSVTTSFAITLSITNGVQAGIIRHDRSNTDYLNRATLYPSVGRLQTVREGGIQGGFTVSTCSGTLISPSLVLTAAHCIEPFNTNLASFKTGYFTFNNVGSSNATFYPIVGGVIKREYLSTPNRTAAVNMGFDIAILRLFQDVSSVTPAELYTTTDENGRVGTYVGFGQSGDGYSGTNPNNLTPAGTKRAGRNRVWVQNPNLLGSDFDNPDLVGNTFYTDLFDGNPVPVPDEYHLAPGDSGGGLFVGLGAEAKLAGVNSFVRDGDGNSSPTDYRDQSYATRVSSWTAWINNVKSYLTTTPAPTPTSWTNRFRTGDGNPSPVPVPTQIPVFPIADGSELMPYESAFDNLFEVALTEDNFSNTDVPAVPTPALLPGLIGLGLGLLRKRKTETEG
jgi:hypothetical protein